MIWAEYSLVWFRTQTFLFTVTGYWEAPRAFRTGQVLHPRVNGASFLFVCKIRGQSLLGSTQTWSSITCPKIISNSSGASGLQTCAPFVLMQRLEARSGGRALLILKIGHVLSHRLQAGLACLEHAVARGDIRQRRNQTPTFPLPSFKSSLLQNEELFGIDSIDIQKRPPWGTSTVSECQWNSHQPQFP